MGLLYDPTGNACSGNSYLSAAGQVLSAGDSPIAGVHSLAQRVWHAQKKSRHPKENRDVCCSMLYAETRIPHADGESPDRYGHARQNAAS